MELVFTLPILGLLLLGLLEFSLVFFARADVAEACRAGARKATLHGTTLQDVETEVRRVLAPGLQAGLQVDANLDVNSGDVVSVSVSTPMSAASPDLLWPIGFSLDGRQLYCQTRMVKE